MVFAALIFSGNLFSYTLVVDSFLTFIFFCLASGSIYILNDILDKAEDAVHPEKCNRPIAAGLLPVSLAASGSAGILIFALAGAFYIKLQLGAIISMYILLTLSYSIKLKHVVIVDIILVAIGFVLRAVAGAVAIDVEISSWLLVCTFFLALFLVIGKRRNELSMLQEEAVNHRKILDEYNRKILDQMIAVVTAISIVGYA